MSAARIVLLVVLVAIDVPLLVAVNREAERLRDDAFKIARGETVHSQNRPWWLLGSIALIFNLFAFFVAMQP